MDGRDWVDGYPQTAPNPGPQGTHLGLDDTTSKVSTYGQRAPGSAHGHHADWCDGTLCDACKAEEPPPPAITAGVLAAAALAAVVEAHTPEGAVTWLTSWLTHPERRGRAEAGVLAEWSGKPQSDALTCGHRVDDPSCNSWASEACNRARLTAGEPQPEAGEQS